MRRIIRVTKHALEQHRLRWPSLASDDDTRRQLIVADVHEALGAGRLRAKEPSFTTHGAAMTSRERKLAVRRRTGRDRNVRFAWTADRRRVYLTDQRGDELVVITAIRPDGDTHRDV